MANGISGNQHRLPVLTGNGSIMDSDEKQSEKEQQSGRKRKSKRGVKMAKIDES